MSFPPSQYEVTVLDSASNEMSHMASIMSNPFDYSKLLSLFTSLDETGICQCFTSSDLSLPESWYRHWDNLRYSPSPSPMSQRHSFCHAIASSFFSKSNLQCILFLYISSGLSYPVVSKPLCALHLSSALFQSQISFLHLTTPCLPPIDRPSQFARLVPRPSSPPWWKTRKWHLNL